MPVCLPASQFCCGCSLVFGVRLVLIIHLLANLSVIVNAAGTMIFGWNGRPPPATEAGMNLQVFLAAFCLAGLPIIFGAVWGTIKKVEALLRIYLAYMTCSFCVDMYFILKNIVFAGTCSGMSSVVRQDSQAFACGVARGYNTLNVFFITMIQLYFMFIVLSHCEDLRLTGCENISDLVISQQALDKKLLKQDMYNSMFDTTQKIPYEYGSLYNSGQASSLKGLESAYAGNRIFNGRYHEMMYPPPLRASLQAPQSV